MQKVSEFLSWQAMAWLVSGVLAVSLLTVFQLVLSQAAMQTTVITMPAHSGFSAQQEDTLSKGTFLGVGWEDSMPSGYERIYIYQDGAIIGSLPESQLTSKVRARLSKGVQVKSRVVGFDPLLPSRALTVQVIFG